MAAAKKAAKATNVRIDGRVVRVEFASDAEAARGAKSLSPFKKNAAAAGAGGKGHAAAKPAKVTEEERRARAAFGDDDGDDDDDDAYEDRTSGGRKRSAARRTGAASAASASTDPYEGIATFNTESSSASMLTVPRPKKAAGSVGAAAPKPKKTKFTEDGEDA